MRRNGKKNVRNRAEFVYNRNGDNMNTLQEAREKINAIDAQMADLFEERMRTDEDVIQYKKEHQMQVLDPTREQAVIERVREAIRSKVFVGCTACRYCIEHCPRSLDIPELIRLYNDMVYSDGSFSARNAVNALPADKQPSACIGCGHCQALCPQQIHIPDIMRDLARRISE